MLVDHSDSKIAEMTIQGNQTGINKTINAPARLYRQDAASRGLTEKLLATEQSNAEQLKKYL
jgi:hypothetical protein